MKNRASMLLLSAALMAVGATQSGFAQTFGDPAAANGANDGYSSGYQDGYSDAYRDGYGAGYDDATAGRPFDDSDRTVSSGYGPPSGAQSAAPVQVSFGYFYDQLAPYGRWYHHPRWGDVWHPLQVEANFRPYSRGHWVDTDEFGWTWDSDYPWSDIPFHYGRWVYDPVDGWLWVPGYVWSPGWVVWRSGGGNVGWFPMPPDDQFLAGYDVYRTDWDWNRGFGYRDWYGPSFALNTLLTAWVFVDLAHFGDRDYGHYVRPQNQYVTIINNTTNVTNYVTVNNRVINRSVDVTQVERASGRRVERVAVRDVIKAPVTDVAIGRQVQTRERQTHGGDPKASARERVQALPASAVPSPAERRLERRLDRSGRDQQTVQPGPQPNVVAPPDRGRVERRGNDSAAPGQGATQTNADRDNRVERPGLAVQPPDREDRRGRRDAVNDAAPQGGNAGGQPNDSQRGVRVETNAARERGNAEQRRGAAQDNAAPEPRQSARERRGARGKDDDSAE